MNNMKIINVIGFSGTGKTHLITRAIQRFKNEFDMESAVIKNIHEHQIDKEGKDSYIYTKEGANYAITKNIYDETTIFLKKEVSIIELIEWLKKGPFKIDIIFTEGFRDLNVPTILCLKKWEEIDEQELKNVKMISGIISLESERKSINEIPIVNVNKNFQRFKDLFDF